MKRLTAFATTVGRSLAWLTKGAFRVLSWLVRGILTLIAVAGLAALAYWLGSYPYFRPIASVGLALFVCFLFFVAGNVLWTAYLGFKGRA